MEIQLSDEDTKLYSRLYVSRSDIAFARYCVKVLLRKQWHGAPWGRKRTAYRQQSVFTSALVISYSRPFKKSYGWPSFPVELLTYDETELTVHDHLITLRDQVIAHSDSAGYHIRPRRSGEFITDVVTEPLLRITAEHALAFKAMAEKLLLSIDTRLEALTTVEPRKNGST